MVVDETVCGVFVMNQKGVGKEFIVYLILALVALLLIAGWFVFLRGEGVSLIEQLTSWF